MITSHKFSDRVFSEFFPPPRFLEMPAVGLDISDDAVSVLELVRRGGSYAVGRFSRVTLPAGIITGGYVNDKERMITELRTLKEKLKLDFVNTSLSEEKAYLFKARVPRVAKKELRSALEFKLEENVPIPPSEAIFDYTVITDAGHNNADHIDVCVTVLPRKVVDTYSELLEQAGLTPLSFEIEAQAVTRAVVKRGDRGVYLVVHFGDAKTGLFIVCDEVVQFTSTVAIGGNNITEAIMKHLSVGAEEARRIKHERGAFQDRKNMDLFFSIMNTLSALKDEVNKLSVYWHTHKDATDETRKPISKIILTGRDAGLSGFDEYLSLSLSLPAEVGNVWCNPFSFEEYIPPLVFEDSLDYVAAIGLALPKGH